MDFSIPQRQDELGIVIYFFNNLRKAVNAFFGYILISAFNPKLFAILGIIVVVLFIGIAVFAWFQYRLFTFYVQDDELIIDHGVFVRDRLTIPFERIQAVHLHQNIIQRLLNITGLKIDTAGSKEEELEIRALKRAHALKLREILSRKPVLADIAMPDVPAVSPHLASDQPQTLVKLTLPQLLLLSITENHIKNGLLAAAVIFGYISQYRDFFDERLEPFIEQTLPQIEVNSLSIILSMIVIFLLVSILISTIKTFLRYFDLEAFIYGPSLQISSGLLSRKEAIVPLKKIQFMEWYTNFLRKPLGFETVKIYQAQSHEQSKKQAVEIPACYAPHTAIIMEKVFRETGDTERPAIYKADASYIFILSMIFLLPGLAAAAVLSAGYEESALWYLLLPYTAIVAFFAMKYVRSIGLRVNDDLIVYERGWLFPRRTVLQAFKVQSVMLHQTIFQKRSNVAHITLYTAAGKRTIRYMPLRLIKELHNFLLYKVESHKGDWM